MNIEKETKSQLLTTEPEKKETQNQELSKRLEEEQNHRNEMEITWRVISRERERGIGEKVPGIRSINGR